MNLEVTQLPHGQIVDMAKTLYPQLPICEYSAHDSLTLLFSDQDSKKALEIKGKITEEELILLIDLKNREEKYSKEFYDEYSGDLIKLRSFITSEYAKLQSQKELSPDKQTVFDAGLSALSLTSFAMRYALAENTHVEFNLRPTQQIAQIRALSNWVFDKENQGILEVMNTGEGKTDAVLVGVLPALLLVKKHIDVMVQKPVTRERVAARFARLGDLFGLVTGVFDPAEKSSGYHIHANGTRGYIIGDRSALFYVNTANVSVLLEHDLNHLVSRLNSEGVTPDWLDSENRGVIIDEIDDLQIDQRRTPREIAMSEMSTSDYLSAHWKPFSPESNQIYQKSLLSALEPHMQVINSSVDNDGSNNQFIPMLSLMRHVMSSAVGLYFYRDKNPKLFTKPYLSSDNRMTDSFWYDIKRAIYAACLNQNVNLGQLLPEGWDNYLDGLFPDHIRNAIEFALFKLTVDEDFFVTSDGRVELISQVGYPLPQHRYEPLVNIAVYVRATLSQTDTKFPKNVQLPQDRMSIDELQALAYSKALGLTGSPLEGYAVAWFRQIGNYNIVRIPSQFSESAKTSSVNIIACTTREDKAQKIISVIKSTESENGDIPPFLIDVESIADGQFLSALLSGLNQKFRIQLLLPQNEPESKHIFELAGQKNTISIVFKMARREVDIKTSQEAEDLGGLAPIAFNPLTRVDHQKQLAGRSGRFGRKKQSLFVLVGYEDMEFFRKYNLQKMAESALVTGNTHKLKKLIKQIQKENELEIFQGLTYARARLLPFIKIRHHQKSLTDPQIKKRLALVWPDFQTAMDQAFTVYSSGLKHFPPGAWISEYRNFVLSSYIKLYRQIVQNPILSDAAVRKLFLIEQSI